MPLQIPCPCGKTLKVPENLAGKKVKCPACAEILEVPASPPPPQWDPDVVFDEIASSPKPPKPANAASPSITTPVPEVPSEEAFVTSDVTSVSGGTVVAIWNNGFVPSPFATGTLSLTPERVIETSQRLIGRRRVELLLPRVESAALVSHGHAGLLLAGFLLLWLYGFGLIFLLAYMLWRPTYLVIRGSNTTLAIMVRGSRQPYEQFLNAVLTSCSRR